MLSIEGVFSSISISNYSQSDCDISFNYLTSPLMQTLRIVHIILSSTGLLSTSLFAFVLFSKNSSNLHINLRVSLISLSLASFIACLQLLFTALYGLALTLSMDDHCNAIMDAKSCALVRWPIVLSIYCTLGGLLCIAIERTIATIRYKTYEVHGSRIVSFLLVSAQWLLSLFFSIFSLSLRSNDGFLHYCTVYISHPKSAVLSVSIMTILELFMLSYFATLLNVNKRKQVNEFVNNALHSLTERYQLLENVRIMQILIPSVTVHAALSLGGLGALLAFALLHRQMSPSSVVQFAPYSELVLLLVPVYAVVFPIVAVGWNTQMRNATKGALPCLFGEDDTRVISTLQPPLLNSRPSRDLEKESDRHFGLLVKMWNK